MHGVGKTQLALKYAEHAWKEKPCLYIFWMSAASVDKLVGGFSRLLDAIGLGSRQTLDQSARCVAARNWLEDEESQTKRRWLLVLDNTSQEVVATLREMLPRENGGGKILLTTRTKQTAEALTVAFGERHTCIDLAPLGVDQSVQLLLRVSGSSRDCQFKDEI
jgi:NB-ARC domain